MKLSSMVCSFEGFKSMGVKAIKPHCCSVDGKPSSHFKLHTDVDERPMMPICSGST